MDRPTGDAEPEPPALGAADRAEVADLIARYNWAMDTGDADALVDCYAADGSFSGGVGTYSGHEALRAQVTERRADHRRTQHVTSNLLIEAVDADHCRARCYCVIVGPGSTDEAPNLRVTGYYEDQLVRTGGRWRFATREFHRWP